MRDPNRIDEILKELRIYWTKYPDLRLGQIISNMTSMCAHVGRDPFYFEDTDLLKMLKKMNIENDKTESDSSRY